MPLHIFFEERLRGQVGVAVVLLLIIAIFKVKLGWRVAKSVSENAVNNAEKFAFFSGNGVIASVGLFQLTQDFGIFAQLLIQNAVEFNRFFAVVGFWHD